MYNLLSVFPSEIYNPKSKISLFDWIPLNSYTPIYHHVMLFIMLITLLHAYQNDLFDMRTRYFSTGMGVMLLIFIVLYLGTRPVSYVFGDMGTYGKFYNMVASGQEPIIKNDYVFNYFLVACSKVMTDRTFFFVCAALYVFPCYVFSRRYCGSYWY